MAGVANFRSTVSSFSFNKWSRKKSGAAEKGVHYTVRAPLPTFTRPQQYSNNKSQLVLSLSLSRGGGWAIIMSSRATDFGRWGRARLLFLVLFVYLAIVDKFLNVLQMPTCTEDSIFRLPSQPEKEYNIQLQKINSTRFVCAHFLHYRSRRKVD
jgi:hypothetical protein